MSQSTTISIRPEAGVKARLDELADATNRSKSFLAAEAIRAFVELNEWQIRELQAALQEADAGDLRDRLDFFTCPGLRFPHPAFFRGESPSAGITGHLRRNTEYADRRPKN